MINVGAFVKSRPASPNLIESRANGLTLALAPNSFQPITDSLNNRCGHGFTRFLSEKLGEFVGFRVFDVETHVLPV